VLTRKQTQVLGIGQKPTQATTIRLLAGGQLPGRIESPLNGVQTDLQYDDRQTRGVGRHRSLTELDEILVGEAPAVLDVKHLDHGKLLSRGGEHAVDEVALEAATLDDALQLIDGCVEENRALIGTPLHLVQSPV